MCQHAHMPCVPFRRACGRYGSLKDARFFRNKDAWWQLWRGIECRYWSCCCGWRGIVKEYFYSFGCRPNVVYCLRWSSFHSKRRSECLTPKGRSQHQCTSNRLPSSLYSKHQYPAAGPCSTWNRIWLLVFWNAINVRRATMTTPTPYAKDLGNLLYHSAVVSGLSVGYSMVGKSYWIWSQPT